MIDISNGRQEIVDFCKKQFGITSWQSVRAWRRELSFPIRYLPTGKPFLIHKEAIRWAISYDNHNKPRKKAI